MGPSLPISHFSEMCFNPRHAELFFCENTVDPDQMASDEAI